jgi:coniferyl-aldehyde dehydrogenase
MNIVPATDRELNEMLIRQRAAFLRDGPPTLKQRRDDLGKLRASILAWRAEIERAVDADFGHRSRHETALMELMTTVRGIDYLHRNLRRFMAPTRRHVALTLRFASARIEYQPLGVIGIIAPWNYPLSLALMPLATAIAAGNRAMIKPSEFTPQTSRLLARLLAATFSDEQIAVVTGDAAVGAAFAALPFDHLLFTGSTPVGRSVMRAASANLVPVTLELGGKSPVIVAPGWAHDRTAASIAFGKLANAGQTCIAPDYAMVHADEAKTFLAAYRRAVEALYPDGPTSDDYTSIINDRHFVRLRGLIDDARAGGAWVADVGRHLETAQGRARTLAPVLVLGATDEMAIMQEEIFGPILPVLTYGSIDEAIAYVNAHPRPLALYYFGNDDADRRKVLSRTTSGNVGINNTMMHYAHDDLPFGGVGPSGIGTYHGIEGFRRLSPRQGHFGAGPLERRQSPACAVRACGRCDSVPAASLVSLD